MIPFYHTINDLHQVTKTGLLSKWNDFHIIKNESVSIQMVSKMDSHICDFHHICLDFESDYQLGLDNATQKIINNSLYFVPKGTIISWSSDHRHLWRGYTIFFKPDFLLESHLGGALELMLSGLQPLVLNLKHESSKQLSYFCEQMLLEQLKSYHDTKELVKSWLILFIQYSNRYFQLAENTHLSYERSIKYKFQELIHLNINKEHKVSFYADALNISPRHFTRLIKKVSGVTAKKMIQEKIVEIAKVQLLNTNISISQVAYSLGFTNVPQFTKVFKTNMGLSPSAYRKARIEKS